MQGYNFTERTRKVLAMAREESMRLRHEYVGTEHILLGLIREGEGVAATVLANLHVDLGDVDRLIEQTVKKGQPGSRTGPDLPYTSRAKKVLELAMTNARELNHSYVGTEHLLLGLIAEKKGIAAQVLADHGVTLENATVETLRILGTEVAPFRRDFLGASSERLEFVRAGPQGITELVSRFLLTLPLSQSLRVVLRDAEAVAAELNYDELTPVHVAMALLRRKEGIPNTVLEQCGCDAGALLRALEAIARGEATES